MGIRQRVVTGSQKRSMRTGSAMVQQIQQMSRQLHAVARHRRRARFDTGSKASQIALYRGKLICILQWGGH